MFIFVDGKYIRSLKVPPSERIYDFKEMIKYYFPNTRVNILTFPDGEVLDSSVFNTTNYDGRDFEYYGEAINQAKLDLSSTGVKKFDMRDTPEDVRPEIIQNGDDYVYNIIQFRSLDDIKSVYVTTDLTEAVKYYLYYTGTSNYVHNLLGIENPDNYTAAQVHMLKDIAMIGNNVFMTESPIRGK